jgi:hypothetical protein
MRNYYFLMQRDMTNKKRLKQGPKPNHLKIDADNWEDAVKKAIRKGKPKEGWPDKSKKKSN